MILEAHIIAWNEERMLPWTLRHYSLLGFKIILWDSGSTDRTREIAAAAGIEVRDFKMDGVNDQVLYQHKSTCWQGTKADWVVVVDTDELVYFPQPMPDLLASYELEDLPIVKLRGYDMLSYYDPDPKGPPITRQIIFGARGDEWYGKPALINPREIKSLLFGAGAHKVENCILKNGKSYTVPATPTDPPAYLLHYHHLGPIERIAARYDLHRSRFAPVNRQYNWGNWEPGILHAADQRDKIVARLEQVLP